MRQYSVKIKILKKSKTDNLYKELERLIGLQMNSSSILNPLI